MTRLRVAVASVVACVAVGGGVSAAQEIVPCQLGGPAGTSSVLRVDLPRGSASLALRVTTVAPSAPQSVGHTGSWHLATQIAVVRASDGRVLAYRAVQQGSSPSSAAVSVPVGAQRVALPSTPSPFRHVGASVPPFLPSGRYLLVAFGSDGSPALPNPGWSAEAAFGVPVTCVPLRGTATVFDRDQTHFDGGTQVSAYAVGIGSSARTSWRNNRRYVVGLLDAGTQAAGEAHLSAVLPGRRRAAADDALTAFWGSRGTYEFTGTWSGVFPLLLVCALAFDV